MKEIIRRNLSQMKQPYYVLVTGGASGIGRAQAEAFHLAGHRVLAVDRDPKIHDLQGDRLWTFQAQLNQEAEVAKLFDYLEKIWGQLNVLCNTAGQLDAYRTLGDTSYEDWQEILASNLDSMFLVTKKALAYLIKEDYSRVINMASIAGMTAGGGGIAYTTAKHGIIGFTKQLAYDYSKEGLRANAIAPGAIDTPMNAADFAGEGTMAYQVAQETPVQRWARPEEVAQLSLYLASDAADYIQGAVIPLDGGWMIR